MHTTIDYYITNKKMVYIILAIIVSYFVTIIGIPRESILYGSFIPNLVFFIIVAIISYFIISKIFNIHIRIFKKFLIKYKIEEEEIIKPFYILGGIISISIVIFLIFLTSFSLSLDNSSIEQDEKFLAVESIILQYMSIIPYILIGGIVSTVLYQLYYLNKLKVPIIKSLIVTFSSMILLLFLLFILFRILDIFGFIPAYIVHLLGLI